MFVFAGKWGAFPETQKSPWGRARPLGISPRPVRSQAAPPSCCPAPSSTRQASGAKGGGRCLRGAPSALCEGLNRVLLGPNPKWRACSAAEEGGRRGGCTWSGDHLRTPGDHRVPMAEERPQDAATLGSGAQPPGLGAGARWPSGPPGLWWPLSQQTQRMPTTSSGKAVERARPPRLDSAPTRLSQLIRRRPCPARPGGASPHGCS